MKPFSKKSKTPPQKKLSVHYRLSVITRILLLSFAVIVDGIQFLLTLLFFTGILIPLAYGLSILLSLLIFSINGLMLLVNKVSPFSARALIRISTAFLIEFTPALGQFVPSATIWILLTIRASRKEDVKKAEEGAKIAEAQRQVLLQKRARQKRRSEQIAVEMASLETANDNAREPMQRAI